MKKFVAVLAAVSMLLSTSAYAQNGRGARNGAQSASSGSFNWTIGVISIAALATTAGIVAASSSGSVVTHG